MSSPFSIEAVDMLKKINMRIYKIPSGEVNNIPLLEKIKKTRKEVFLSTGMSNWEEINDAYKILKIISSPYYSVLPLIHADYKMWV